MIYVKHFALTVLVALVSNLSASAYDFEVDGIYYNVLSLEDLTCEVTYKSNNDEYGDNYKGTVNIPSEVSYGSRTFIVVRIGNTAFRVCREPLSITIPNTVTTIGVAAFEYSDGLTEIQLPNSVLEIGTNAFAECRNLSKIVFSKNLKTIGYSAFLRCVNLENLDIHNSVVELWQSAFEGCNGLRNVVIPNSVSKLGGATFRDCKGLQSIMLSKNAHQLTSELYGCSSLEEIVSFKITPPIADEYSFSEIPKPTCVIKVPNISVSSYQEANYWKLFWNIAPLNRSNDITLDENKLATVWLEYDAVIPDGVEAYYAKNITGTDDDLILNLYKIHPEKGASQTILPRNTGVVLRATEEGTYTFYEADVEGLQVENLLIGDEEEFIPTTEENNYYQLVFDEEGAYSLMSENADGEIVCSANQAYLPFANKRNTADIKLAFHEKESEEPIITVYDGNADSFMAQGKEEAEGNAKTPNALFFTDTKEEDLPNNYIYENVAKSIILTDAAPFYCPSNVTTDNLNYTRNFESDAWQAFYVPFPMSYEEWSDKVRIADIYNVHQYDRDDDGVVDETIIEFITIKNGGIEANKPYVVKPLKTGETTFIVKDRTLAATPIKDGYVDCMSTKAKYTITGTYQEKADMYANGYYAMSGGNFMQAESSSVVLSPFSTYLKIESRNGGNGFNAPKKVRVVVDGVMDDEATAVEGLTIEQLTVDHCVYNLTGQKVDCDYKGIVINNGSIGQIAG